MFQSKGRDKTNALQWEYGLRGDRLSKILATPGGLEPPTPRLGILCSILLMQLTQGWFHLCRASRYAAGPVFYQAFETNASEPPLILMGVRKSETGSSLDRTRVGSGFGLYAQPDCALRAIHELQGTLVRKIPHFMKSRNRTGEQGGTYTREGVTTVGHSICAMPLNLMV